MSGQEDRCQGCPPWVLRPSLSAGLGLTVGQLSVLSLKSLPSLQLSLLRLLSGRVACHLGIQEEHRPSEQPSAPPPCPPTPTPVLPALQVAQARPLLQVHLTSRGLPALFLSLPPGASGADGLRAQRQPGGHLWLT